MRKFFLIMLREILERSFYHRLWFDIYTGDIYFFSRIQKRFVEINESTSDPLQTELREYFLR